MRLTPGPVLRVLRVRRSCRSPAAAIASLEHLGLWDIYERVFKSKLEKEKGARRLALEGDGLGVVERKVMKG